MGAAPAAAARARRRALARPAGLFLAALHAPFPRLSTAFPRRFAPQARELWLVGGERSLLGHTVSLEEYAGCSATGPPNPIVSHSPTDDHKKYGLSYIDMDTRAKFHCDSLCSVGVRMRGPLSAKARPRYVLEVYNKHKVQGKGSKEFDETDAYVLGCLARTSGAAISWTLGNHSAQRTSDFAHQVCSSCAGRAHRTRRLQEARD